MENREEQFNIPEKKELPEWAKDIKIGYDAWKRDFEAMKRELGEREGLMGDIHRREFLKMNIALYEEVQTIEVLPEFIPLPKEEDQVNTIVAFDHEAKKIAFTRTAKLTVNKYFLPKTYELCENNRFLRMSEEDSDQYSPNGEHFVGFEEIKILQENKKRAGDFYTFVDIKPVSLEQFKHESRVLADTSVDNRAERSDVQRARGWRDTYGLNPEEIEHVIKYLQHNTEDAQDKERLVHAAHEIEEIKNKFPEVIDRAKQAIAERIRRRIVNLCGLLEERFKKQLPEVIDIMHREWEGREVKAGYFFLTKGKNMVKVPYKKGLFSSEAKPDFSKAVDAPDEEWLKVGLLGDMLIDIFPYEIRDSIKRRV